MEAEFTLVADQDLIFKFPPNLERELFGVPLSTNELGLRDKPIRPKRPDDFRVLCLGDSVTFGQGVAQEHTFCQRMEDSLTSLLGRDVDVINSGVPGYNTNQQDTFLQKHGDDLDPDLVVLVYVHNDILVYNRTHDPKSAYH